MTKYLVAAAVGPVQEFIAAGRKTRDLWYGSHMLSEIARALAEHLQADHGADLIFPHPDALKHRDAGIANKLLCIVETDEPGDVAAALRERANTWLSNVAAQVQRTTNGLDWKLGEQQVAHFLEVFVAWVPYSGDAASYATSRQQVERRLAGRKALRDFVPAEGKSGNPKSSLDPSREGVLPRTDSPQWESTRQQLRLSGGEALDAISVIKRVGGLDDGRSRFPSVVRVAADPYLRMLAASDPEKIKQLRDLAAKANMEALLQGRFRDQYADFPYDSTILFADDPDIDDEATKAEIRELVGRGPSPYFATLIADGDGMGRYLNSLRTPEDHRDFSQRLAGFAMSALEIVRDHRGVLVYSGGDDVMAFLPVDSMIDCADALRVAFARNVSSDVTLSAGISVGHYREPLYQHLDWARQAEKLAKRFVHPVTNQAKNAVAIAWHSRSGGEDTDAVTLGWSEDARDQIAAWVGRYQEKSVPSGVAYELRQLAEELSSLEADTAQLVIHDETRRILKRKRVEGGGTPMGDSAIDLIASRSKDPGELERMTALMILARRIANADPTSLKRGMRV